MAEATLAGPGAEVAEVSEAKPGLNPLAWRYSPHLLIFFSSACIMIVEIVAGRLLARHLGNSLYTWTSVIGVVLAGMSIGNFLGGRLADRFAARSFLGWLFVLASASCLLCLLLNHHLAGHSPLTGLNWPLRILFSVLIIFLVPALVLGTISPVTAKLALDRSLPVGATIGSVYAWGTVGSIAGTLAAGFWMIAWLGSQGVVLLVAVLLSLLGFLLGPQRTPQGAWFLAVLALFAFSRLNSEWAMTQGAHLGLRNDTARHLFVTDSHYQYIQVSSDASKEEPQRGLRRLTLDYLIHGYVDLKDPQHLEYDYERVYRDVALKVMGERTKLRAFFIGGGSYTFPRWVLDRFPGSEVVVAEIDPQVLEANHQALGLARETPIRTICLDARNAVDDLAPGERFDLVFGDAFNDLSVPWHLTTLEFDAKIAAHLAPRGLYLVNLIDSYASGLLLGAYVRTLRRVFKHVQVFCSEAGGVRDSRDTFVVAAAQEPLDFAEWVPGHKTSFIGSLLSAEQVGVLELRAGLRILTDDDAPVDQLLAPVVRERK